MREWLIRLVAGNRAYWISPEAARQFKMLNGMLGGGAAIALVDAVRSVDATRATFEIDGWTVTVSRTEPIKRPPPPAKDH